MNWERRGREERTRIGGYKEGWEEHSRRKGDWEAKRNGESSVGTSVRMENSELGSIQGFKKNL